jgi:uncharacterized protein (DUF305 family)
MSTTRPAARIAAAAGTIALSLVLAACGGEAATTPDAGSGGPAGSSSTAVSQEHNDADIAFVQGMIPHHAQAIEMAQLAEDRADSPQVEELAATIERAQDPEIGQMRGFLQAWGVKDESAGGMGHGDMGHGGMGGMPGMMTEGQLQQLEQASGAAFDRMFLQLMIDHHTGAVQMARTELGDGQNPQAKALAQQIIDHQSAEIATMQQLLQAA